MSRLEWGFAGTSSTTLSPPKSPNEDPVLHSKWIHWIDSQTDDDVDDEGNMYPVENSDRTLERGSSVDAETGKVTHYEECWTDVAVIPIAAGVAAAATDGGPEAGQGSQKGTEGPKKWSIVLALEDEQHGVKGMIVRVGQFCQGIIKARGEVSVERWAWSKDDKDGEGQWQRTVKLGRMFLPCALTFEPRKVEEGSVVKYGDYVWTVREAYSW